MVAFCRRVAPHCTGFNSSKLATLALKPFEFLDVAAMVRVLIAQIWNTASSHCLDIINTYCTKLSHYHFSHIQFVTYCVLYNKGGNWPRQWLWVWVMAIEILGNWDVQLELSCWLNKLLWVYTGDCNSSCAYNPKGHFRVKDHNKLEQRPSEKAIPKRLKCDAHPGPGLTPCCSSLPCLQVGCLMGSTNEFYLTFPVFRPLHSLGILSTWISWDRPG